METYLLSKLYHTTLLQWYKSEHSSDTDLFSIQDLFTPLSSLFIQVFKQYPSHHILLLSSDGKVSTINTVTDPTPELFRSRRFMKIDNKTSISSIHNVITYLYQLLSITVENKMIDVLDMIGLVQFVIYFIMENDVDATEWNKITKKYFFSTPPFLIQRSSLWKEVRDPILKKYTEPIKEEDIDINLKNVSQYEAQLLLTQETLLTKLGACHSMISKLCATIEFQDDRITILEELIKSKDS